MVALGALHAFAYFLHFKMRIIAANVVGHFWYLFFVSDSVTKVT